MYRWYVITFHWSIHISFSAPVAPAVQTSEAALVLVAGAAEMGLPGIFSTQAIRSSHVKGASMLGDALLYQSSTRHRTIQKTKRPFKLKVWSSSNASLILSSAAKITYVVHIPSCLSLLKLKWFLLPWSFLRFCSKRSSKSIYFSREIIGNHGGWHPSFARNTNRFMGCICTWVYMTLKP